MLVDLVVHPGVAGEVDERHTGKVEGLPVGEEEPVAREILAAALGQQLGTVTTEVVRRQIDVQPTLEIRPGYRFNIEVTQDIVLPGPYKGDS